LTPLTDAERQRLRWLRKTNQLEPVQRFTCAMCGRSHLGAHGELCSRCWTAHTEEGRADRLARVQRSRQRQRSVTAGEADP
jgi:hypothetical protein